MFEDFATIIGAIAMVFFILLIAPFLCFWAGYFGGWIAKITIGNTLCNAINTLFSVSYFTPDKLPTVAGALAWIGSYFKSSSIRSKS